MNVQTRWPTLVIGWAFAVAVTALIAWRAVHFVGGELGPDIAISRPRAAAPPAPRASSQPAPRHTPAAGPGQPAPDVPAVITPDVPQPAPVPPTDGPSGGPITTPPVVDVPDVPIPQPSPQPNPQPNPQPIPEPEQPAAEPPDDGPVVALPPPFVPAPDVPPPSSSPAPSPPPSPAPEPTPVPIKISDRRSVETAGGMATFTCTELDVLALETTAPAPGYELGRIRLREISRMDVFFVAPSQEQRIDARCDNGTLDANIN